MRKLRSFNLKLNKLNVWQKFFMLQKMQTDSVYSCEKISKVMEQFLFYTHGRTKTIHGCGQVGNKVGVREKQLKRS